MDSFKRNNTGYVTGMAGEFHAMELLFRKGHHPALTLGNAKQIDILTYSPKGNRYDISVKANRSGGKWPIGSHDYSTQKDLVFMLFLYKKFQDIAIQPELWIIPAPEAERIKLPWHNTFGVYSYKQHMHLIEPFKDAWHYLE